MRYTHDASGGETNSAGLDGLRAPAGWHREEARWAYVVDLSGGLRDTRRDSDPDLHRSHDSGIPGSPPSPTEFTLGHNVSSKEEVDAVMEQARNAGAVIVREAHDTFWGGYAGYFENPDRHLWEVVWNPQLALTE